MEGQSAREGLKLPSNAALEMQPRPSKRRRIVDSDTEIGSDSENDDHVPLAQRVFQFLESSSVGIVENSHEVVDALGSRDKDEGDSAEDDCVPSPAFDSGDGLSRWSDGGDFEHRCEQEFQDMAEIYGGQNDVLIDLGDDDDEELGDAAFCAICDDGGDLLFCDGPCMRSFHASKAAASLSESKCDSLGYTVEEVKGMGSWLCDNCVHGQHQCFKCGQLGISEGKNKEVFVCDVALCGRFYHPHCLAEWKEEERFNGVTDMDAFIRGVKEGVEGFCCPAHKCRECGEGEEEGGADNSMKLAKCRRCPKAYHKACLPKQISFESRHYEPIRAWEIGDRLVIYCLAHEIVTRLSTPHRKHLKWPKGSSMWKKSAQDNGSNVAKHIPVPVKDRQKLPTSRKHDRVTEFHVNKPSSVAKPHKNVLIANKPSRAAEERCPPSSLKWEPSVTAVVPSAKRVDLLKGQGVKRKAEEVRSVVKKAPISREGQKKRILQIMQRASDQVTMDNVKNILEQPSCYGESRRRNFIHRGEVVSILHQKVSNMDSGSSMPMILPKVLTDPPDIHHLTKPNFDFYKAARKASEKSRNGGNVEDAKQLCRKDQFLHLLRAEDALRVHLAPFLHGMRYTSFGRHFTCIDKLEEIVKRIHPYIDQGDMVVDFCCGANDFSIILNRKLITTGKTCHFRNFDIHPPKNDFCFTKGDWLKNEGRGFFEGKNLVMGLNPPFGVRAALANMFILHALSFRPKLLVLIVPPETMNYSLDYKKHGYDLIWEDKELLKGHAFYLPGSLGNGAKDNMTQWNNVPPPLYLWSSRDMARKHREIALLNKHVGGGQTDVAQVSHRKIPTPSPSLTEVPGHRSDSQTTSGSTGISECGRDRVQDRRDREVPRHKSDGQTTSGSTGISECGRDRVQDRRDRALPVGTSPLERPLQLPQWLRSTHPSIQPQQWPISPTYSAQPMPMLRPSYPGLPRMPQQQVEVLPQTWQAPPVHVPPRHASPFPSNLPARLPPDGTYYGRQYPPFDGRPGSN